MAADDLADVASERFFEEVLEGHPLGRPIGGSPDTIRAARRDDVNRHYHGRYDASTLVVTAAGAVDHDRLVDLVVRALDGAGQERWSSTVDRTPVRREQAARSGLPAFGEGEAPARAGSASQPSGPDRPEVTVVERPSEQINLLIGTYGLPAGDPRRFAFGVMNSVLGGGMSSRLFQEIREKRGLAYTAYSFGASYSDAGVFGMYAGTAPQKAAEAIELAQLELRKIAGDGITEDEYELALGQISGSSALALEDSDTRMGRLGRAELGAGELYDLDASLERFRAVTVDEVKDVAATLLARPFSVVAVGEVSKAPLG